MGDENTPVLLVTGVDPALLYRQIGIAKKVGISAVGLLSLFVFVWRSGELNTAAISRMDQVFQLENVDDVMRISTNSLPVGLSLAGIHLLHEGAHRFMAWKGKVIALVI